MYSTKQISITVSKIYNSRKIMRTQRQVASHQGKDVENLTYGTV
jgi:hypothetical protein